MDKERAVRGVGGETAKDFTGLGRVFVLMADGSESHEIGHSRFFLSLDEQLACAVSDRHIVEKFAQ